MSAIHPQTANRWAREKPRGRPPLDTLQSFGSPADPQDMTRNDEPIYEIIKSEHNWDPERREPLRSPTPSVGRHRG